MSANDQLTALDATFLELEEADDGALMHIGGALVFASRPGGGTPTIDEIREHLEQRLDLLPRYRQKLDLPRTGGLSWPSWERDARFEIAAHVRHATLPSPGDERDFWTGSLISTRIAWIAAGLCGKWSYSTVWRTTAGRCCARPTTAWSTASARSISSDCCSARRPHRPSRRRLQPPDGAHGWLPNPFGAVTLLGRGRPCRRPQGRHAVLHPREALERSRRRGRAAHP